MANLNLSQFGENSSVSDADYTFVWDSVNSISKKVSRNSWLTSPSLSTSAPVTISQTWNGTGSTVFKALVVNATTPGTTSSSGSLLLDLQVGGTSAFNVNKGGAVILRGNTPSLSFNSVADQIEIFLYGKGLTLNNRSTISFSSTDKASGAIDAAFRRQGVGEISQYFLAVAQSFKVYNTAFDTPEGAPSDYERGVFDWRTTTNTLRIGTEHNGSGVARELQLVTGGASRLHVSTAGNVGIGTTSPTSNLTVAQGTAGVGTISVGAAGTTVTGVGTQFLNTFAVGQTITSAGQTLTITAIASATSMTISPAAGAAISGQAYTLVGGTRFSVAGHGDIEVNTASSGLILKSPDGTRYRVTVPNGGAVLTITAV